MVLRALLVSADDVAIANVTSVLSELSVTIQHCVYPAELFSLPEYKLDALIVDFDDAGRAISIVQSVRSLALPPIIVAILKDPSSLRDTFAAGANFVLYKPLSEGKVRASLKAAVALMSRERRRCCRVPVQVPVKVQLEDGTETEGILLNVSEEGMDIITADPMSKSARIHAQFVLPDAADQLHLASEVAWAKPNGESGMRFVDLSDSLRDKFKEFVCKNAPDLPSDDLGQDVEYTLSDLSLGGCYIETESPYPEHSLVELCLTAEQTEVSTKGTVKVMHPGVGMGIEFASPTSTQREAVQELLTVLTSSPTILPTSTVTPRALFSRNGTHADNVNAEDDPLLHLLRNHESLNQEEFLREMKQQRTTQELVTA